MPDCRQVAVVAVACGFAAIGIAAAHVGHEEGQSLGTVHFPVSCTPEGQAAFEHGLALLHHMTYPQAREAFQQVSRQRSPVRNVALGNRDDPVPAALADASWSRKRASAAGTNS